MVLILRVTNLSILPLIMDTCMHELGYSLVVHQFLEIYLIFIISQCRCFDHPVHLNAIHS